MFHSIKFFNLSKLIHKLLIHFLKLLESRLIHLQLVLIVHFVKLSFIMKTQDLTEGDLGPYELDNVQRVSVSSFIQQFEPLLHVVKEQSVSFREHNLGLWRVGRRLKLVRMVHIFNLS